jgi:hypothetical protein
MKILLEEFNAKVGIKNVLKLAIGNQSLHQDSNDNGVRIVNFATSRNLVVNTLRTGNFLLKIFHRSLIWSEVPFTIRRKATCIV